MHSVPSTLLHEGDPPASVKDLAHNEHTDSDADVDSIPHDLRRDVSSTPAVDRRFFCHCGRHFAQQQSVFRHDRVAHKKLHSCFVSRCIYKWYRPCEYRAHIEKRHPKASSDKILGKIAGDRSRSKIVGRDTPLHPPPPPIESERRNQANVTHVSPPAMSSVACDPQPEYTEPAITTCRHEDTVGLECLGTITDDPSVFSEEYDKIMNELKAIIQFDQDRTVTDTMAGSTANDRPTSPGSVDPMVELPSMCSHSFCTWFCIADYEITDQET